MEGYDKLAALMTGDKGLSIFRSFKMLNTKNLLFLQAEITIKEKEFEEIMLKDRQSGDKYREKYSSSVRLLKGMDEPSEQWRKWLEIRELLEKYNTAFAQHAQLLRLRPPHKRDLDTFRDWLDDNPICVFPVECLQWFGKNDEERGDLVALSGRYENVDLLTNWVFQVVIPLYDRLIVYFRRLIGIKKHGDIETGPVYYDDEKIIRATRLTSTITSSVIPASSMLVLYLVNNMVTRLIIIVVYNIGFSIIIGLLAKARRVEVFAASTAFAAVQVAFITNFPRD
ncbi:uncharacterized protein BDW70DRAFT_21460 [Aspergillus foveolatus]|uniref:uncharacterized protein n=1 Tax=Aspergillus foveolatus TaxID=210207 RepID=UPI003CCDBF10